MPEKPGEKFGDLLVKAGLIDEMQLQAALGHQRRWGGKFGKCLVDLGFITETELLQFMSDKYKIPAIDLTRSRISDQAFAAVPESVAKKYGVVPVFLKEGPGKKKTLTLAMSDPTNLKVLDEVQFLTGFKAEPVLANESAISKVLDQYGHYEPDESGGGKSGRAGEFARPSDLRKEHAPAPQPEAQKEPNPHPEVELVLGGEEPSEGMPEIMDLEEAESEGVEITPDEDVQVIKDEVVMVKADVPRPKAKVGSSTERIPSRAPIREKVGKVPKVESYSPPAEAPAPPPRPDTGKEFLKVPDVGIEPAATDQSRPGTGARSRSPNRATNRH